MPTTQPAHDNLTEIRDPVARSKLTGIQESVWSIELEVKKARSAIEQKLGAAHAYKMAAEHVFGRAIVLNKQLNEAGLEVELAAETKIRVDEVKKAVALLQGLESEQRRDLADLRGQIGGMERAIKSLELRFVGEAKKVERWQRMEDDENAERTELDTPPAEGGNGAGEPPAELEPEPPAVSALKEAAKVKAAAVAEPKPKPPAGSEVDAKPEPKPPAETKPRAKGTDKPVRDGPATKGSQKRSTAPNWRRPK